MTSTKKTICLKELVVDPTDAHFAVFCEDDSGARPLAVQLANLTLYDQVIAVTDDFETSQLMKDAGIPLYVHMVQDWAPILERLRRIQRAVRVLLIAHHRQTPAEVFDLVSASIVLVSPTLDATVAPVVHPNATWLVPRLEDYTLYPALLALRWPLDRETTQPMLRALPARVFANGASYVRLRQEWRFLLPRELVAYQRQQIRS